MTRPGVPTLQVITRDFRKTPVPMTLPITMDVAAIGPRPRMSGESRSGYVDIDQRTEVEHPGSLNGPRQSNTSHRGGNTLKDQRGYGRNKPESKHDRPSHTKCASHEITLTTFCVSSCLWFV